VASVTAHESRAVRIGRALASPVGVVLTIPLLVVAVGVSILLVGRDATREASLSMARRQLTEQATAIQTDVAFALDQADPLLERLAVVADPTLPRDEVLVRLHDLIIGRPGVAYVSISFPDGAFRGAYLNDKRTVEVQESRLGADGTLVSRGVVRAGVVQPLLDEKNAYDPRQRGFYQLAEKTRARAWTAPYTFYSSFQTGITCTQPVYDATNQLRAVLTVDFDVGALSTFVARPALDQARSVVYTRDGTILAYPAADRLVRPQADKLLRHEELQDPALAALFANPNVGASELTFVELDASDGAYFASVAPIGGTRAGIAVPLDWYVATVVPVAPLMASTHRLERSSVLASAGALAFAVGLALVLAWNLVRMRRQVAVSRAEARSAEARARELGSYRLVAKLGHGGMGEVWRAEHRLLARSAAVKLIRPEALEDPDYEAEVRERFRREAQVLASMRSRHTIAIFDYGVTSDGIFYYVMELLDGLDLESLVVTDGAQPAARVIKLMIQACSSLAEAHDAGLLHRDIKPPNLMLSRAADEVDVVKLLDFGIVQTANEPPAPAAQPGQMMVTPKLTQLGAMLGTPGFMSPEQILGMQCDGRSDLYALGCVAWWLLAGNEVFPREKVEARVLQQHLYEPVPSLSQAMPSWCPPELEAVLTTLLAKEPEKRPTDARHLAAMLRAIPIPPEHAWTEAHAQEWWRDRKPERAASNLPSHEHRVLMPGSTDARPEHAGETLLDTGHKR
jgi:serine/threonine protein kinase